MDTDYDDEDVDLPYDLPDYMTGQDFPKDTRKGDFIYDRAERSAEEARLGLWKR